MQITLERQSKAIALSFNTDNSIAYDELYLAVQDKMSAIVNGGKFFVGKAFTIVGNAVSVLSKNIYVQGLTVAAAGGLGSRLAGGSFELGFLTAGLAFAVNQVVTELAQEKRLTNPTGGTIRSDGEGDGNYGSPRGNRDHLGLDITSTDGQGVVSPVDGSAVNFTGASTGYPIVDITPTNQSLNIDLIRILYVGPSNTNSGGRYNILEGGVIGNSVNLQGLGYSNGVTPHVHIQIQSGGQWVDPTPYFFSK